MRQYSDNQLDAIFAEVCAQEGINPPEPKTTENHKLINGIVEQAEIRSFASNTPNVQLEDEENNEDCF